MLLLELCRLLLPRLSRRDPKGRGELICMYEERIGARHWDRRRESGKVSIQLTVSYLA